MLSLYFDEALVEAGVDEAGRGCLAGPVVAAAVILPRGYANASLNDSKQLTHAVREDLFGEITQCALAFAIAEASAAEIDRINILQASFLAMHRAIDALGSRPELLLIDGNRFRPYPGISHRCMVKGDARFQSIAAASILAKVHRDRLMQGLAEQYPQYGWSKNMGYPTAAHQKAITVHGPTEWHRKTFGQMKSGTLFG